MAMRVATATLTRAPLHRLTEWVAYHLAVGVDEIHLFFDDPQDPALDALAGDPRVFCHRCDERFWREHLPPGGSGAATLVPDRQAALLAHLLREVLPGRSGPDRVDWLTHLDTDELMWAPQGVRAALEQELRDELDHLQLPPLEAVPPRMRMTDAFREVRLFKEHRKERYGVARRLGVTRPFRGRVFLRGHRKGKPIVRVGRVETMRVHGPGPTETQRLHLVTATARELRILHFDAGSFAEWRRKWEHRAAFGDRLSAARVRQTRRFERAARGPRRLRRLRRLYRREYMLTPRDARILRALGLVHRIELDAALFDPVAPRTQSRPSSAPPVP